MQHQSLILEALLAYATLMEVFISFFEFPQPVLRQLSRLEAQLYESRRKAAEKHTEFCRGRSTQAL
jgi:hypothetical protein